jgi:Holliday junction DNA helicase RuvB
MDEGRVIAPEEEPEDRDADRSLRPQRLDDFVGQEHAVRQLETFVAAAGARGEACDHVLLAGPPGLGKTSLAFIVAAEMGTRLHTISGPAIERKGDVAAILTALEDRDVLFVDEVHRLPRAVEELLYPAMEDGAIDIVVGQGPGARTLRLDLAPFTLVGATTRAGLLTTPLRDRFGISLRLEYYSPEDLLRILERAAGILGVALETEAAVEIARRSRGTPRVANRILRRVRDVAQVRGWDSVDRVGALEALDLIGVDEEGLDRSDREYLRAVAERFAGGPVGLSTLAVALGEDAGTLEEVHEPYLIQRGFIQRTARGRILTALGRRQTGMPEAPDAPSLLD